MLHDGGCASMLGVASLLVTSSLVAPKTGKPKKASERAGEALSKRINANIEAQMIELSEREKKGMIRTVDIKAAQQNTLQRDKGKHNSKTERKKLQEKARDLHNKEKMGQL